MVQGINGDELAAIIKSNEVPEKDYVIIDVRDDDYVGGNIHNSHNRPSSEFLSTVDELVRQTKDVPKVIFTCTLSQRRGPKAAQIYEETRKHSEISKTSATDFQALVLQGGFQEFREKFNDDQTLVDDWDKKS